MFDNATHIDISEDDEPEATVNDYIIMVMQSLKSLSSD
jgi:hypothetical protein